MNYFIKALKNYTVFKGRATRPEYWYFVLFSMIFSILIGIVDSILGLNVNLANGDRAGILGTLFSLAVLVPSIAVGVRRLHDTNRSGWWILIGLIPFLGWIALIVFLAMKGNVGENKYGPDPKGNVVAGNPDPFIHVANNPSTPPESPTTSI